MKCNEYKIAKVPGLGDRVIVCVVCGQVMEIGVDNPECRLPPAPEGWSGNKINAEPKFPDYDAAVKVTHSADEPTRQATGMRFDLIPGDVLAEVARVFAAGAAKYGDTNWKKGRLTGDKDPINHALKHINYYNSGIPDDEDPDGVDMELHLRNAIVNLMFELHYQRNQDKYGNRFK